MQKRSNDLRTRVEREVDAITHTMVAYLVKNLKRSHELLEHFLFGVVGFDASLFPLQQHLVGFEQQLSFRAESKDALMFVANNTLSKKRGDHYSTAVKLASEPYDRTKHTHAPRDIGRAPCPRRSVHRRACIAS